MLHIVLIGTHLADGVVLLLGHTGVAIWVHAVHAACVDVSGLGHRLGLQAIISNLQQQRA